MHLDMHDAEVGNSLNGRWNGLDFTYQVEQAVQESGELHPWIIRWVAFDGEAELATWERRGGVPVMLSCSTAWQGTWRPEVPHA